MLLFAIALFVWFIAHVFSLTIKTAGIYKPLESVKKLRGSTGTEMSRGVRLLIFNQSIHIVTTPLLFHTATSNKYQSKKSRSWNRCSEAKKKCEIRIVVWAWTMFSGIPKLESSIPEICFFPRRHKEKSVLTKSFSFGKYTYRNGRFYAKLVPQTETKPRSN